MLIGHKDQITVDSVDVPRTCQCLHTMGKLWGVQQSSFLKAKSEGNLIPFFDVNFLKGLDEGLFLSFQISVNLPGNTSIILNPCCIIKTVKTCHGCSILIGLQLDPLALPKMSMMEEYLDYAVASCPVDCIYWVSREELQARLPWWVLPFLSVFSHAGLSRCWSMPGSTVDWVNLSNRERRKRSVRSRRRRWWKRRDSCLVLFLSCRTESSHHDWFVFSWPMGALNTEK